MKIFAFSDVHTEFKSYLEALPEADVCILAGDIVVAHRLQQSKYRKNVSEFIQRISDTYSLTVVIAGNHEYYHGPYEQTDPILREFYRQWPNVVYLQRENVIHDGVVFAGCTLWTDFDGETELSMDVAERCMTDYRVTSMNGRYMQPSDTLSIHKKDRWWLKQIIDDFRVANSALDAQAKLVIVTHHAPSFKSVHPMFATSNLNGSFMSELPEDMFGAAKLWVHGHSHWSHDYDHHGTRVILNARGYPGEIVQFDPTKVIEI